MPFKVEVVYWGGTLDISTGSTFGLEDMTGLGAASVRRLAERGPQQDGDTDLGHRTDPAILTLPHLLIGTTDAHLDTLRDTLQQVYLPTADPLRLRVTRDDGNVRQLDVHRTGPLDMPLRRLQRPGHFGRAVVQLKASDPVWYTPTAQSGTLLGASDWWLGYNTIGTANVLEHVESPTQGQQWSYTGTVAAGNPWMIAFRSGREIAASGSVTWAFEHDPTEPTTGDEIKFVAQEDDGAVYYIAGFPRTEVGTAIMSAGTHNYFMVERGTGGHRQVYRDGVLIISDEQGIPEGIGAPSDKRHWRSNNANDAQSRWSNALPRAAIYNISPTPTQIGALNNAMTTGGSVFFLEAAYGGQWPEYPVIRINGPISDPIITNTSTGESLNFTGITIGSADYYTIDTRYGRKTVTNSGGDNRIGELTSDSDLVSFHIAPPSEVTGGTNIFSLSGTAAGSATSAVITYYNRFPSY